MKILPTIITRCVDCPEFQSTDRHYCEKTGDLIIDFLEILNTCPLEEYV